VAQGQEAKMKSPNKVPEEMENAIQKDDYKDDQTRCATCGIKGLRVTLRASAITCESLCEKNIENGVDADRIKMKRIWTEQTGMLNEFGTVDWDGSPIEIKRELPGPEQTIDSDEWRLQCNKCGATFKGEMSPWGELFLGREIADSRGETGAQR
jgi:hypothetical protein